MNTNNYNYSHEPVADFACRKVLGLRSVTGFINGYNTNSRFTAADSFSASNPKSKSQNIKKQIKLGVGMASILASVGIVVSKVIKKFKSVLKK